MAANEWELATLKQLIDLIQERSGLYGKVVLKFGFLREKGVLKASAGTITFTAKGEETKEETRDYGNFLFTRKLIEPSEVSRLLREIVEDRILSIPGIPQIPLKGNLEQRVYFIPSMGRYGYMRSEWPATYCTFQLQSDSANASQHDLPARLEHSLYPNAQKALIDFLELRMEYLNAQFIAILVPDYRTRIKNFVIAGNKVRVEIESRKVPLKELVAKVYCEADSRHYHSENLPCGEGYAEYEIDREPTQVLVYLLNSATGEDLDNREFNYRWTDSREGVTIERNENEIREIIHRGENENVELKRDLSNEQGFLQTVVAFSNSSGGTIFLGVDDNSEIVGFVEKSKDKIINLIVSNIEPTVQPKITTFTLKDTRAITLVEIPEGSNKPYSHRELGVFVRKGASNRHATRTDLDAISPKRQS